MEKKWREKMRKRKREVEVEENKGKEVDGNRRRTRQREVEENNGNEVDGNRMRMRKGREEKGNVLEGKCAVRKRNEGIKKSIEVDELEFSDIAGVIDNVIGEIVVSSKRNKSCPIFELYTHANERYP